jgi:Fic family protein
MVTLSKTIQLLKTSKPTASKAISALAEANVLRETTGRERDRVYAYHAYLRELTKDAD